MNPDTAHPDTGPLDTGRVVTGQGDPLPDEAAVGVDFSREHLNSHHADALTFVARHLAADAGDGEAFTGEATLGPVDTLGADFVVGERRVARLAFADPVSTLPEVQANLMGALAAARAADPDAPQTSIEAERAATASLPTLHGHVAAVTDLRPGLRQLTLGGFEDFPSIGGDQFVLVIVPKPGQPPLPDIATFATIRDLPDDAQPGMAYYTVRAWRPEAGEIDAWFVLHAHDGPVSGWARRAEPGTPVVLWGPREAFTASTDPVPQLLVADETGLGAVAAILDERTDDRPTTVLVETPAATDVDLLPAPAGVTIRWIDRGAHEPGTGTQLLDAVRGLAETGALPDDVEVYGAGESKQLTAIRKFLRNDVGLPKDQVNLVAYWRRTPTDS